MRISERKQQELYNSISLVLMDLRIKIQLEKIDNIDIDNELFKLESKIWDQVKKVLGLHGR